MISHKNSSGSISVIVSFRWKKKKGSSQIFKRFYFPEAATETCRRQGRTKRGRFNHTIRPPLRTVLLTLANLDSIFQTQFMFFTGGCTFFMIFFLTAFEPRILFNTQTIFWRIRIFLKFPQEYLSIQPRESCPLFHCHVFDVLETERVLSIGYFRWDSLRGWVRFQS